ncbi:hypothetical protein FPRO03_10924 [Fusarium proliferatum]|nr:hypothetical protein FPRO03_10924 [Fusarium proliferatum]
MKKDSQFKVRDEEKECGLVIAIRGKHSRVAEILLEHNVSADASHPWYGPAISNASQSGLAKIVRVLIEARANVNRDSPVNEEYCKPALCVASENGHLKIVEDLLQAGAHVGIHESVRLALINGHTAIVELLAEKVLEPRSIVITSQLLDSAASHGTIELVRRLLDTKPNILCISSALSIACKAGCMEIAWLIFQHAKAHHKATELEASPGSYKRLKFPVEIYLYSAAESGNEHLVQMLLDNVFDLSRVVDIRQIPKDPAAEDVQEAILRALKGCHQRVITTLLDAMVNHAHTHDYTTLRAASEVQNHHILRNFSVTLNISSHLIPPFAKLMNLLYEIFLGDHKQIFQPLIKEAGAYYFQFEPEEPIEVAAGIGNAELVVQLIQADIVLNVGHALYLAVKHRHEHVVRILLNHITEKNLTIDNPKKILTLKILDSIVHMFLDQGINFSYDCSYENTPLHYAAKNGNVDLVERLLSHGHAVDPVNFDKCTPLHIASSTDVKRVLLAAGANVNAFNREDLTLLHTAAQRGAVEEIELMLQFGTSIYALRRCGITLLDAVLLYGESSDSTMLRTTKFLLGSGLGANDKNGQGAVPLHYACVASRVDAAMLLIKNGADVNAKDIYGFTPLHWVSGYHVSKATADLLSLLADHGADFNSQENRGSTALHVVGRFENHGSRVDVTRQYVLADMAELLLDYGVDIDARDNEGKTALYGFLKRGLLAVVELLIKRGADVKALTNNGETMLHAMNGKASSLCPNLLERGVRVNALTIEGWSPIAFALDRHSALREKHRLADKSYHKKQIFLIMREVERAIKLLVEKGGKNIRNWQEEECSLEG